MCRSNQTGIDGRLAGRPGDATWIGLLVRVFQPKYFVQHFQLGRIIIRGVLGL